MNQQLLLKQEMTIAQRRLGFKIQTNKVIIQHFRKSTVFHYNNVELDMRKIS
jgi:hypothetical protein